MHWLLSSLRARLIALVLLAVLLLLAASALAVQFGTRAVVDRVAGTELETASRVWDRFLELRGRRLLSAVSVLAEDFGFREAVASGDRATGVSALLNHAARVEADFALLLTPSGEPIAALPELDTRALQPALAALIGSSNAEQGVVGLVEVEGIAVQLAIVPVRAPQRVAWAAFGFAISPGVLTDFRELTGADLSILAAERGVLLASSLAASEQGQLFESLTTPDAPGQDAVIRISRMQSADGSVFEKVLQFERERFEAPMRKLRTSILELSLLMALPAVLAALWAARGIGQPLQELTEAVGRIAAGNYAGAIPRAGGEELTRLASAVDAMQLQIRARESRIQQQAVEDGLTGLPNRPAALAMLDGLAGATSKRPWRLLLIDIRRFAQINDSLGAEAGDALLKAVAERLRSAFPEAGLARLGANEFLLLEQCSERLPAMGWALEVLARLGSAYAIGSAPVRVEFTAGLACLPEDADTGRNLLRRARLALVDAKQEGLPVCAYRPGREDRHLRQLRLMSDLRVAGERGELFLVFQPKIDLRSGRVVHAEALLRWRHPELGMVFPDEFIPISERAGVVGTLTRFALAEAVRVCSTWRAQGVELAVAVNLSALDLADPGLAAHIEGELARQGFATSDLIVEVTESAVVTDLPTAIEQLQRLRSAGVRVAIDDFGTGQSSLAQLQHLPADELKIDKSFVLTLQAGSAEAELVRIAVELGHRFGMQVIAEGIETHEGLAVLRELGCDLGQGYLFSRPMPGKDMPDWCRRFDGQQMLSDAG